MGHARLCRTGTVHAWHAHHDTGAHTFQIPFVAIVVRARLAGLDPAIEEAARDLGANTWQTFWRHSTYTMLPGVVAGGSSPLR